MAVFRVEKNKGYTVMSNYHLRDMRLSLKAKGMLSLMLSLPEDWDYSLRGLTKICREGIDAIRVAVKELEDCGYIRREQGRKSGGQMAGIVYTIYEQPCLENPNTGNPNTENPYTEKPDTENPTQLKKEKQITERSNHPSIKGGEEVTDAVEAYREIVKENLSYEELVKEYTPDRIDEIVELILETVCSRQKEIRIGSNYYPASLVKARLLKLRKDHIEYIMECMRKNPVRIRNIKYYILATLFNASATIGSYYDAEVRHDMYGS